MKFTIGFRAVKHEDLDFFCCYYEKKSMLKHLAAAKIKLTNEQHLERVKEHYYDSHIILCNRKPIGVIKLGVVSLKASEKKVCILDSYK